MLQVYLVRHGETQWNAERRIQGQSDSPLTAHGERQAWQVGERARNVGDYAYYRQRFRPDAPYRRNHR